MHFTDSCSNNRKHPSNNRFPFSRKYLSSTFTSTTKAVSQLQMDFASGLMSPYFLPFRSVEMCLAFAGDVGFVGGSALFFLPGYVESGLYAFAVGSVFCAMSHAMLLADCLKRNRLLYVTAQASSFIGSIIFAVFSITFSTEALRLLSLWGFLIGSCFFQISAIIISGLYIKAYSFGSYWTCHSPKYPAVFTGAMMFVVGSVCLLLPATGVIAGPLLYLTGSIAYLIGITSDIAATWYPVKKGTPKHPLAPKINVINDATHEVSTHDTDSSADSMNMDDAAEETRRLLGLA